MFPHKISNFAGSYNIFGTHEFITISCSSVHNTATSTTGLYTLDSNETTVKAKTWMLNYDDTSRSHLTWMHVTRAGHLSFIQ